jgi:hypothetical protein
VVGLAPPPNIKSAKPRVDSWNRNKKKLDPSQIMARVDAGKTQTLGGSNEKVSGVVRWFRNK